MITLTLKLPKKVEQYLEKDLKHLGETTKKPREYFFYEALVRYIEDMEWELEKRKLQEGKKTKSTPEELKSLWMRLKNTPPEYYFKEALVRYIEDMEDMRDIEKYEKKKKNGKVKYYTSEEVRKELKEYYDAKEAKERLQH